MKTIISFSSLFLLVGLTACSQEIKKIPEEQVNQSKESMARKFAIEILTKLDQGSYYQFEDEATEAIETLLTESTQKAVYEQVKSQMGDFQSLEYVETWSPANLSDTQIYRYKCNFSSSLKKIEARVVIDGSGKIAGFWIKPWSDMLQ